jgi:hypothetical protein
MLVLPVIGQAGKPARVCALFTTYFLDLIDNGFELLVGFADACLGEAQFHQPILELLQQTDNLLFQVVDPAQLMAPLLQTLRVEILVGRVIGLVSKLGRDWRLLKRALIIVVKRGVWILGAILEESGRECSLFEVHNC